MLQVHACDANRSHFELVKRCKRDLSNKKRKNEKKGKGKFTFVSKIFAQVVPIEVFLISRNVGVHKVKDMIS